MRVLHVIPSLSPRSGGPTEAIIPMVAALRERGIAAEIATTDDDLELARIAAGSLLENSVPVRFFSRWRAPMPALGQFGFSGEFLGWLRDNIENYHVLHVHALFSFLPSSAMVVARQRGIPYISRPLGQLGHWPLRQSAWRKKAYLSLLEQRNLQGAAALHFTSDLEKKEANALGLSPPCAVIPHGIDLPAIIPHARQRLRRDLGLHDSATIVLFLGRLHPKKGLDLLLRALAGMRDQEAMLVVAGEGEHRPELERLADELQLTHRVHWLGHVCGERKQLCLQGADLFALTSHHENMGMAVLEALAAGTPVLVSDQVALSGEISREGLGHVVSLNVADIEKQLSELRPDVSGAERKRRRVYIGSRYSWSSTATALAELYQLVQQKSH